MKPIKKAGEMTVNELAAYIDQSVLKPEFTKDEVQKYIQEGIDFNCRTVCINPWSVDLARNMCKGTSTQLCVVCDFPFGNSTTASKVAQAHIICDKDDIFELDIVANYGWVRSGLWFQVEDDIHAVVEACHGHGTAVKVIMETDALTKEQVIRCTEAIINAGGDFAKTSTGFYTGGPSVGASPEMIQLIMDTANGRCKVKGSGGIRTREHFLQLIDMGIDRMGIGYRSTPLVLGLK